MRPLVTLQSLVLIGASIFMVAQPAAAQRRTSSSTSTNTDRRTEVAPQRDADKNRAQAGADRGKERDYYAAASRYSESNGDRRGGSVQENKGNRSDSYRSSYLNSREHINVRATPPPPRDERHMSLNSSYHQRGYVWIPGYWAWDRRSNSYFWTSGYWLRQRSGFAYFPGYWEPVRGGYIWIEGGWFRV